ncbi:lipoyl(octanoyl) transferase LipB [Chiayiivirga flava]|uniref:Octanoyltransferase n=1 Tax=Chiayiivirga flava TaxID=659595 RepID=A0A7W8D8M2_9GAMM|nr:lipoyl(octanoyl) transferase LipB [Chiayiivirga flava]MBB5209622.1 lipoyl(octanoyl) transferase [Chiayiivirga flava]
MDDLTAVAEPAPVDAAPPWQIRDLGRRGYEPVWHAMQQFTDGRGPDTVDELWLVEHEPVFTLGQAGKSEHVLAAGDIPVLRVERGGQVTYHGPGQLVAYPLVDLRRLSLSVRELVCRIEQATIDTLAHWHIDGKRKAGAPGIYVDGAKVMALGLRVRRGCTFHGLAFNVAMDLAPWHRINPCGFAGLHVTQLADLLARVPAHSALESTLHSVDSAPSSAAAVDTGALMAELKTVLVANLAAQLGLDPIAAAGDLPAPVSV